MTLLADSLNPITPLDTFRRVFQWHPRHFWGWAGTGKAKVTAKCTGLLREYGWQDSDAVGRAGVREALAVAEEALARHLRYPIAPRYAVATLPYPRLADLQFQRAYPADAAGRRVAVLLPEGEIRALGVAARTAIGDCPGDVSSFPWAGASPTEPYLIYRDRDGDGLVDQFEAAIATTVTDPAELAVYVGAADRWDGSGLSERWRVQPARAAIAGGVATITGPAWVCARPVLYEGEDGAPLNGLDPAVASHYLSGLTVARRFTDPGGTTLTTAQAVLTWESGPAPWFCCPGPGSDPAAIAQAVARVGIRDAAAGLVTPAQAVYDPATGAWAQVVDWAALGCREPDRVTVRYLAGIPPRDDGTPAEPWATAVCRLAAAELARPVCSCQEANKGVAHWQVDLAQTGATDDLFQAPDDFDNPLGSRRGHLYAWRLIADEQQRPGIAI